MKKFAALLPFALPTQVLFAQIIVGDTLTPEQLVQELFVGQQITASNVWFNYAPGSFANDQIGSFDGTNTGLNMASGIIMATGGVHVALGPNDLPNAELAPSNPQIGDPDIGAIAGPGITPYDVALLELDLIPAGDSIWFRFLFASEEYPEYVCGSYNDAFGLFLSGLGISGPYTNEAVNLALVPGTSIPITINTVNPGVPGAPGLEGNCAALDPNWVENSVYYVANTDSAQIQFDGWTTVFTVSAVVVPNETYHIKIELADASDTHWDSALFLEAGSLNGSAPTAVADGNARPRCTLRVDATNDLLWIDGELQDHADLTVIDPTGRMVLRERLTGQPVSIAKLGTGPYVARVQHADGVVTVARFVCE
ncbi:MAG: choice-of-anchor L domain-containing protein [Flavobacteriales bacterium]